MKASSRARSGLTIVELMVAIGIIGVLVGLLLPAVQTAREAARAIDCQARLRQIALALHVYHDGHRSLPPGNVTLTEGICYGGYGGVPTQDGANWLICLLPYMESAVLQSRYDFSAFNEGLPNREVCQSVMTEYSCPSDQDVADLTVPASGPAATLGLAYRPGSYRAVTGRSEGLRFLDSSEAGDYPAEFRGAIHTIGIQRFTTERWQDIRDGESNTLIVGESSTSTMSGMRTLWAYSYAHYSLSAVTPQSRTLLGDYEACTMTAGAGGSLPCRRGWGSFHPGRIHFAMADGSIRAIGLHVELELLAALATIDAGEPTAR